MSTPRKHIASRYLDNLGGDDVKNSGPLQPSVKLNQSVDLTPKTHSRLKEHLRYTQASEFEKHPEHISPSKSFSPDKEGGRSGNALLRSSPFNLNTNLEKSIAELKLDSPSPLKRTSKPKGFGSEKVMADPPQWNISNRNHQKGYDYLCRIGEAKGWIEKIIGEQIPSVAELSTDALRDGVILAKLTKEFKPEFVKRIVPSGSKLQFKHTENINLFFQLLDFVKMPDLFRFELTDLYDKKNIPKVIFCVHALSFMLAQDHETPTMEHLSGKLDFTDEEAKKSESALVGISLPNFESMNRQFNRELPSKPSSLSHSKKELLPSALLSPAEKTNPFLEGSRSKISGAGEELSESPKFESKSHNAQRTTYAEGNDNFEESLIQRYNSSPSKKKATLSESEYLKNIIKFQSIARGSIFRYTMFVDRIMLKSMSENIIQVQALARRSLILNKHRLSTHTIEGCQQNILELQSIIRGRKQRELIKEIVRSQPADRGLEMQCIARGSLVRRRIKEINHQLTRYDHKIIKVQSKIRRNLAVELMEKKTVAEEPITKFQARARKVLYSRKMNKSVREAHSSEDAITILQSAIRAIKVRHESDEKKRVWEENLQKIVDFQAISRGGLKRSNLNYALDVIDYEQSRIDELVAIFKAKSVRLRIKHNRARLALHSASIVEVQATVRGVLSRFDYDLFLDSLDYFTEETVGLQASIRGFLYRKSKKEVMKYYEGHLPAIIKIQSYIRGKYLGSAYKSLISMPNPPSSVIKRFAYLLNDSDVDFEEEVNLTRIKEAINEKTSSNEVLEKHISQLDLKIALLQKNKISLDELLVQKNQSVHSNLSHSTIDVSSLNRRAKTRMELYEKLFYLLQTQPNYLTRLINADYRGIDVSLKIFNNLQAKELPTREEYLYIRLVESTLKFFITKSQSVDDLQKHKSLGWQRLLRTFSETQHDLLHGLLGSLVGDIISDSELSLESDPVLIYKTVHNTPKILPVERAIEDPETKAAFISNLQQLREYGSEIFRIINDNIDKIPNYIKVLANASYRASMRKFPHNLEQEHLANAGFVLISGFINLIFENPDFFHVTSLNSSERNGQNLSQISKLLIQLFLMKPFGAEDVYLKPLNKFINSSVEGVRSLIKSIIDVAEIDSVYNMSVYDDMTAHNRPKLVLRISDMVSIEQLIKNELNKVAPLEDDTLREIMVEIQSNNASDVSKLHGYYTLSLNPSSYKASPGDSRVKALFMQVKRCVLYLIQVQDDKDDLFELLKSKIDPIHEIKFKQMINAEKKDIQMNRVNEYVNDGQGFLGDLSNITYHKLKQLALERILELESINRVSRYDSFQVLLNEIAHDIRTKHDQRISRKKQLSIAENTLIRLDEKEKYLEDQLYAYNSHIDKSMEELQSKPTKTKRILPFTKQFFYERELKKSGSIPKFGAYKYSSKRLYEKGILIELRGLNQDLGSSGSSFFGGFNFPKIDFMFNCDQAGVFTISSKSGTLAVNGSLETLTIDQLLEYQFENKPHISLFAGMAKFDTNCLINFIFRKFYHFNQIQK
jgi:Ras GTPase-activating-like protein IQGAP2/3